MFVNGHHNNNLFPTPPPPSFHSMMMIDNKEDNNNTNRRYSSGSLYRASGHHLTSYSLSECENLDFNNLTTTETTANYQTDSGYQTTCYGDGGGAGGYGFGGYSAATGGSLVTSHLPSQIPSRCHSPPPTSHNRIAQHHQNYYQQQISASSFINNNNNHLKSFSHDCQQVTATTSASSIKSSIASTTKAGGQKQQSLNNNHHLGGLHISVNQDVNFIINKPERVLCLMNNLWEEEVECAREWLEKLDWKSYENYQGIQEKIALMEEYYRKAFDMEAPSCDFMEECYRDVTSADTLLSMVESAWQGTDDEEEDKDNFNNLPPNFHVNGIISGNNNNNSCYHSNATSTMERIGSKSSNNNNNNPHHHHGHVVGPRAIVKTSQGILPPSNILSSSVNKVPSDDLQSNDSSGSIGKPMQVHKRASKPKREDAYFNIRYKTQECSHYKKGMQCPAGDNCHFAHGIEELRRPTLHPKFKTQVCSHFVKHGVCPYGDKCFFVHDISSDSASQ